MRKRTTIILASLVWANPAFADEARVHVTAGAAHTVGGPQGREFGTGGGGSATIELAVGNVVGVQASGGAVVLSAGEAPSNPTIAKQSTGSAFLGTVGLRLRPLGARSVGGPWIDANGGVAETGGQGRIALDTHLGWDFRVSEKTRWDVGPFVGFTQVLQPDAQLRPDDARIAWAGIQFSLGATERPLPAAPTPRFEQSPPPKAEPEERAEVQDFCPPADELGMVPEGCPGPVVTLIGDRIVLEDVIHFELDSPRIRKQSTALVRRVAEVIIATPHLQEVSIEGHADARGTDAYNQVLSTARAESTREMLVGFGVPRFQLQIVGHGKSQLKVPTRLADERNRRVEFIVTRQLEVNGPPPAPPASPKVASIKRGQP